MVSNLSKQTNSGTVSSRKHRHSIRPAFVCTKVVAWIFENDIIGVESFVESQLVYLLATILCFRYFLKTMHDAHLQVGKCYNKVRDGETGHSKEIISFQMLMILMKKICYTNILQSFVDKFQRKIVKKFIHQHRAQGVSTSSSLKFSSNKKSSSYFRFEK